MDTKQIIFELASTLCPEKIAELVNSSIELGDEFIDGQNKIIDTAIKLAEENYTISNELLKAEQTLTMLEKTAGAVDTLKKHGPAFAKVVGGTALTGLTLNLMNDLVSHAHESVTRNRNFNRMMEYMPELKDYDQKQVKYIFDSLHMTAGPDVTRDPVSAAYYVKNNVELQPNLGNSRNISELLGIKQNRERANRINDISLLREKRESELSNIKDKREAERHKRDMENRS